MTSVDASLWSISRSRSRRYFCFVVFFCICARASVERQLTKVNHVSVFNKTKLVGGLLLGLANELRLVAYQPMLFSHKSPEREKSRRSRPHDSSDINERKLLYLWSTQARDYLLSYTAISTDQLTDTVDISLLLLFVCFVCFDR